MGSLCIPDGTLAGRVGLKDGRILLFKGDVLLEELNGVKIVDSFDICIYLPDGTLKSNIKLGNGVSVGLFWYGDEVTVLFFHYMLASTSK